MHAKCIERIVITEYLLDLRNHEVADNAGSQSDNDRSSMGWTNPAAGVWQPNPATAPEMALSALGLPLRIHSARAEAIAAAAVAKCVFTKALVASAPDDNALPH